MNNEMNTNNVQYFVSETARDNYKDFLEDFNDIFPNNRVSSIRCPLTARKNCAEAHIVFEKQIIMEELVGKMDERLTINVLYAIRTQHRKNLSCIVYSMPYLHEMYVMQIESNQYGIIDSMDMAFYDSIDEMYEDVRLHYLRGRYLQEEPGAEVLEEQSYQRFLSHFM